MKSMLTIQIYGQAKIFAVKITYTSSIGSTLWLLLCIDKILICNNILVAVYTIIQTYGAFQCHRGNWFELQRLGCLESPY